MSVQSRYTRAIHPDDYDIERGRFKSISFKPYIENGTDLGISVFDSNCGIETSGSLCAHTARYYSARTGDPAIYWQIPDNDIPSGCGIESNPSSTGDNCHRDIIGWSQKESGAYIKKLPIENCIICDPQGIRPLQKEDLDKY